MVFATKKMMRAPRLSKQTNIQRTVRSDRARLRDGGPATSARCTDENGDKRFIRDDRRSVKGKTFSRSAVRVVRLRSV